MSEDIKSLVRSSESRPQIAGTFPAGALTKLTTPRRWHRGLTYEQQTIQNRIHHDFKISPLQRFQGHSKMPHLSDSKEQLLFGSEHNKVKRGTINGSRPSTSGILFDAFDSSSTCLIRTTRLERLFRSVEPNVSSNGGRPKVASSHGSRSNLLHRVKSSTPMGMGTSHRALSFGAVRTSESHASTTAFYIPSLNDASRSSGGRREGVGRTSLPIKNGPPRKNKGSKLYAPETGESYVDEMGTCYDETALRYIYRTFRLFSINIPIVTAVEEAGEIEDSNLVTSPLQSSQEGSSPLPSDTCTRLSNHHNTATISFHSFTMALQTLGVELHMNMQRRLFRHIQKGSFPQSHQLPSTSGSQSYSTPVSSLRKKVGTNWTGRSGSTPESPSFRSIRDDTAVPLSTLIEWFARATRSDAAIRYCFNLLDTAQCGFIKKSDVVLWSSMRRPPSVQLTSSSLKGLLELFRSVETDEVTTYYEQNCTKGKGKKKGKVTEIPPPNEFLPEHYKTCNALGINFFAYHMTNNATFLTDLLTPLLWFHLENNSEGQCEL